MNILVTGHQGRIGTHLVPALVEAGHTVRGSDIKSGGDILADNFAADIWYEFHPDVIIHLAGQSSVQDSVADPFGDARTNILGTLAMLEMAKDIECKVVVATSAGTIRDTKSPYGLSEKVAAEYAALYGSSLYVPSQTARQWVVTLGLSNVYGPGMGGLVEQLMDDWDSEFGVTINGDGTQARDFIYIDDVVKAFLWLLKETPGYYEIATGVDTQVFEVFRKLTFLYGFTPHVTFKPALPGEVRDANLRCDIEKRWKPINIDEGLKLIYEQRMASRVGADEAQ